MKKYLLAALVVVSAPLFAAEEVAEAGVDEPSGWSELLGAGCFGAPLDAARIAALVAMQGVQDGAEGAMRRMSLDARGTLDNLIDALQEVAAAEDEGAGAAEVSDNNGDGNTAAILTAQQEEIERLKQQVQTADAALAAALQRELDGPSGLRRRTTHERSMTD